MGFFNKLIKSTVKSLGNNSKVTTRQYKSGKVTESYSYKSNGKTVSVNKSNGKRRVRKTGY